jgi:hypothetical protein
MSPPGVYAGLGFSSPEAMTPLRSPRPGQAGPASSEYHVVGIIRTKMLFQQRPKPVVSKHLLGK